MLLFYFLLKKDILLFSSNLSSPHSLWCLKTACLISSSEYVCIISCYKKNGNRIRFNMPLTSLTLLYLVKASEFALHSTSTTKIVSYPFFHINRIPESERIHYYCTRKPPKCQQFCDFTKNCTKKCNNKSYPH